MNASGTTRTAAAAAPSPLRRVPFGASGYQRTSPRWQDRWRACLLSCLTTPALEGGGRAGGKREGLGRAGSAHHQHGGPGGLVGRLPSTGMLWPPPAGRQGWRGRCIAPPRRPRRRRGRRRRRVPTTSKVWCGRGSLRSTVGLWRIADEGRRRLARRAPAGDSPSPPRPSCPSRRRVRRRLPVAGRGVSAGRRVPVRRTAACACRFPPASTAPAPLCRLPSTGWGSVPRPRTPFPVRPSPRFPTRWPRGGGQFVYHPASHPSTAGGGCGWGLGRGCRVSLPPWDCAVQYVPCPSASAGDRRRSGARDAGGGGGPLPAGGGRCQDFWCWGGGGGGRW